MSNIFIFHGSYGNPEENWFPWLKNELEKLGHTVYVPAFPTPQGQTIENWMEVFNLTLKDVDEGTVLVGHSTGAVFALDVIESLDFQINAAFLVAGFIGRLNIPELDEINSSFAEQDFDWDRINENCSQIFLYRSDHDPYVHIDNSTRLATALGVEPIVIPGAGHFNTDAGYFKFERLLHHIKSVIEEKK